MALLAIGAAEDPGAEVPQYIAQVNASLLKYGNYTIECGTNSNTQIYCAGIAFSIIAGAYGLIFSLSMLYHLHVEKSDSTFALLAIFMVCSLGISIGLWSEIVDLSTEVDGLDIANLAITAVNLITWSVMTFILIYSPFPTTEDAATQFFFL